MVGPGLVVATNAHVVAGIDAPQVIDANGRHDAEVVLFDPNLDFAVLRTSASDLAASPLPLDSEIAARGVVQVRCVGYFRAAATLPCRPRAVLDEQTALGRNIYDAGLIRRAHLRAPSRSPPRQFRRPRSSLQMAPLSA